MGLYVGLTREEAELVFWARVRPNLLTGCWEWARPSRTDGYGTMRSPWFGKEHLAHRIAYILENGPIPLGLWVRHRCDNPKCVFPNHLEVGTALDNYRDREKRGGRYRQRGAECHQAKLTAEQVRTIRQEYPILPRQQRTAYRLRYGIARSAFMRALKRLSYQEVL